MSKKTKIEEETEEYRTCGNCGTQLWCKSCRCCLICSGAFEPPGCFQCILCGCCQLYRNKCEHTMKLFNKQQCSKCKKWAFESNRDYTRTIICQFCELCQNCNTATNCQNKSNVKMLMIFKHNQVSLFKSIPFELLRFLSDFF